MRYFAGLDISLEQTAVCIVDEVGAIVREAKVASEPEALRLYLARLELPIARLGLEACSLSRWLAEGLLAAGLNVVCLETRQAKAAMAAMTHKTDRNDARGLAQIVRTGWFRSVHLKSWSSYEERSLLNARRLVRSQLLTLDIEVRGILRVFGIKLGTGRRADFADRALAAAKDRDGLALILEPMLAARAALRSSLRQLHRRLLELVRHDPVSRRLMTVPGVGAVVALAFKTSIDDPHRFTKAKSVGAYLGLVPRKHQSGEVDRNGRITKCGDQHAQAALYEAATVLMTRVHRDMPLRRWAADLARRAGVRRARVALARKLAVIMLRMWRDQTNFSPLVTAA